MKVIKIIVSMGILIVTQVFGMESLDRRAVPYVNELVKAASDNDTKIFIEKLAFLRNDLSMSLPENVCIALFKTAKGNNNKEILNAIISDQECFVHILSRSINDFGINSAKQIIEQYRKALLNPKNKYLQYAARTNNLKLIQLLLENGVFCDRNAIWEAFQLGFFEEFKIMVNYCPNELDSMALNFLEAIDKRFFNFVLSYMHETFIATTLRQILTYQYYQKFYNAISKTMQHYITWIIEGSSIKKLSDEDVRAFAAIAFVMPHFTNKFEQLLKLLHKSDYSNVFTPQVIYNAIETHHFKALELLIDKAIGYKNETLVQRIRDALKKYLEGKNWLEYKLDIQFGDKLKKILNEAELQINLMNAPEIKTKAEQQKREKCKSEKTKKELKDMLYEEVD